MSGTIKRLLEAREDLVLRQPERVRLPRPRVTGAEAEYEAPAADFVERLRGLGDDPRVAVEGRHHPGPDLDLGRRGGHRAGHRDPFPDPHDRTVFRPPQKLVGCPDGVKADRLGPERHLTDDGPAGRHPVCTGLVEREHDPDLERAQRILLRATWTRV
jgi:hypothetical protein